MHFIPHTMRLLVVFVYYVLMVERSSIVASPLFDNSRRLYCPQSAFCECSDGNELEIFCPKRIDPNITVRVEAHQQNNRVEIECHTIDDKIYINLPEWNVGDSNIVKFKYCPLPSGTSIKGIMDRLGIRGVRTLVFSSRSDVSIVRQHLTGLNTLKILGFNGFGLSNLPEDLFDDVQNITSLDLRSNKVHLPVNIFRKLHELEFLELGFNNLSKLEDGVFRNQNKLKRLNLWGNNLRNLTKESFAGASSVTDLDLSANNIEVLQPNVFENFINMTTINLNSNRFLYLPEGLFNANKNLQQIRLMDNRIDLKTLPNSFLAHLPHLEHVIIRCNLQQIPEDLFAESTNLRNLTMELNAFTTIPDRLLSTQKNLLDLNLRSNRLTHLSDIVFHGTPNLVVLRLSHNKLTDISANLIAGLDKLQELYLDNNQLHTIHHRAFINTDIRTLNLENNFLEFVSINQNPMPADTTNVSPFQYIVNLNKLNLRNNSLTQFLDDWGLINTQLELLDLSYNNISLLHYNQLSRMWVHPITINLSHNFISTILSASNAHKSFQLVEDHPNIKSRWILNYNPLKCDCRILDFVQFLQGTLTPVRPSHFELITDQLKCILPMRLANRTADQVKPNELLCPLDDPQTTKKYCPSKCSCWVRTADKTSIFNCSNANFTEIPILPNISLLGLEHSELNLENNNISFLPSIRSAGFDHVNKLNLRNNSIALLSPDSLPRNLVTLDLSGNKLQRVNDSLVMKLNSTRTLKHIKLRNNPWACDCENFAFIEFLRSHPDRVDYKNITCSNGEYLTNVSDVCPGDNTIWILVGILIALLGLFIGAVIALYYKYQQEVKVWLFAHNLCLWFVTEEELDKDKKYDAFISFSHKDEDFVTEQLVPELENGPHPFKICLHFRDWVVGEFIPNQISKSVEDSRRTIVVLTPNFLESIWGRMEFRAAHKNALAEGRTRLIVIIYGDIGDIEKLDPELKCYLKTNTYVKWGDPWFFNKLRYALPHPTNYKSKGLIKSTMKSSIDDRLELIKPQSVTPPLTTPPSEQAGQNPLIGKLNGDANKHLSNGLKSLNGHVNGAFIINTNAKQSDV